MKILYDIRTAQTYYQRGVWRYVIDLLKYFATNFSNDEITVLFDKRLSRLDYTFQAKIKTIDIDEFDIYCKEDSFDFWIIGTMAYFSCPGWNFVDYTYPPNVLKKCKKIAAIVHDFIPVYYQEDCLRTKFSKINYALQFETLKLADYYICNSEYTKSKVIELLGADSEKCLCIYGGADSEKWTNINSENYNWESRENTIVSVTAPYKRKNYHGLAEAFCMALSENKIPQDSRLYLICEKTKQLEAEITAYATQYNILPSHIELTGFISDEQMIDIISNSKATLMPSFYEGLGLPILESYVAGTPAFAANTTSTVEFVSGESSFSPSSIQEMEDVIIKIFNDKDFCDQSFAFGRELIKKVNWNNAGKTLFDYFSLQINLKAGV